MKVFEVAMSLDLLLNRFTFEVRNDQCGIFTTLFPVRFFPDANPFLINRLCCSHSVNPHLDCLFSIRFEHVDEFFGQFNNFTPLRARARDRPAILRRVRTSRRPAVGCSDGLDSLEAIHNLP
jgi:hypothetical protein